jgi:hypothetical protein
MSAYLGAEQLAWLEREWLKRGKKLNMGKACIRFKKLDDLPLDVIGEAIRRVPAKQYVERYESILATMKRGRTSKPARTKAPAKKMATKRSAGASASRNSSARSRTKSGR